MPPLPRPDMSGYAMIELCRVVSNGVSPQVRTRGAARAQVQGPDMLHQVVNREKQHVMHEVNGLAAFAPIPCREAAGRPSGPVGKGQIGGVRLPMAAVPRVLPEPAR